MTILKTAILSAFSIIIFKYVFAIPACNCTYFDKISNSTYINTNIQECDSHVNSTDGFIQQYNECYGTDKTNQLFVICEDISKCKVDLDVDLSLMQKTVTEYVNSTYKRTSGCQSDVCFVQILNCSTNLGSAHTIELIDCNKDTQRGSCNGDSYLKNVYTITLEDCSTVNNLGQGQPTDNNQSWQNILAWSFGVIGVVCLIIMCVLLWRWKRRVSSIDKRLNEIILDRLQSPAPSPYTTSLFMPDYVHSQLTPVNSECVEYTCISDEDMTENTDTLESPYTAAYTTPGGALNRALPDLPPSPDMNYSVTHTVAGDKHGKTLNVYDHLTKIPEESPSENDSTT